MIKRLLRLFPYVRGLEEELERERMRLTACSIAALGWFDGCKDEYKSASLQDVLSLRERWKLMEEAYNNMRDFAVSKGLDVTAQAFNNSSRTEGFPPQ